MFVGPVPICMELAVLSGSIDNFLVTPSGLPVIVECKLWRNPEGRRKVVGQILDYAKILSRWSSSDLQREVGKRIGGGGDPLIDVLRRAGREVDETAFHDALTFNLRRGRFLLLIVGDGIREDVEAIAEFLQRHAGLHFTLGLVEMPIYSAPNGDRLVVPRVLAQTHLITRHVVAIPDGSGLMVEDRSGDETDSDVNELNRTRREFWTEFVSGLQFDDPDQPPPTATAMGYVSVMLPAPGGSSWVTVYRDLRKKSVGLFLSYTRNSVGERATRRVLDDWEELRDLLGGSAWLRTDKDRRLVSDELQLASLDEASERTRGLDWLRRRTNDFVNIFRPRIRAAAYDIEESAN